MNCFAGKYKNKKFYDKCMAYNARTINVICKYAPITMLSFCAAVGHQCELNINTWPQGRANHSEKGLTMIIDQYSIQHNKRMQKKHWRACGTFHNSQCIYQKNMVHIMYLCIVLDISRAWERRTGVICLVIDAGEVPICVRWTQPKNSHLWFRDF